MDRELDNRIDEDDFDGDEVYISEFYISVVGIIRDEIFNNVIVVEAESNADALDFAEQRFTEDYPNHHVLMVTCVEIT